MREWRNINKDLANLLDNTETSFNTVEQTISTLTNSNSNENNTSPVQLDEQLDEQSSNEGDLPQSHHQTTCDLNHGLATFVALNRLPREQTRNLLKLLRSNNNPDLPADPRTLLHTPRNIENIRQLGGGEYLYLGIAVGLNRVCKVDSSVVGGSEIVLTVNMDGLPLRKSSNFHLWPILCKIQSKVFVVAVWSGVSSPECPNEFLKEFLEERANLIENGVNVLGKMYTLKIDLFICDSIARAWLKGTKSPSGYYACDRCTIKGIYDRCVLFPNETGCVERTDAKFNELEYLGTHQRQKSILIDYGVECVKGFIIDSMHQVFLGVVKKLLEYWVGNGASTPRKPRLTVLERKELSGRLKTLGGKMPREFSRQPRTLKELPRYKATEFRQFLLYTGMVVLKGLIKDPMYRHFIDLSVAIRILSDEFLCESEENLQLAEKLLNKFVKRAPRLYTIWFMVYNVHTLKHIVDDVRAFGCLSDITAFDFENHLQVMKKFVRNSKSPCTQVGKRIIELENLGVDYSHKTLKTKLTTTFRDSWFLLKGMVICQVVSFSANIISVKKFRKNQYRNLFSKPMPSMDAMIYVLPRDSITSSANISTNDIYRKLVCLPMAEGNKLVLIAVNHACRWNEP